MRSEFYLDERQQKKRRRILKLKIYGALSVFFILTIGVGYLIVYSSVFRITRIEAEGTQINADEIINNLKVFFAEQSKISKFLGSENILIWKREKISEFLKNYHQIGELIIEKDYFKRLIKISVKEKEKFGIWCPSPLADNASSNEANLFASQSVKGEGCWWFDKEGIIFAKAPSMEGNLINKIDDFSVRPLKIGDKILEEKFLSNLLKILEILEKSDLKIKSLKLEDIALQEIIADSPAMPKIYFSLRIDPIFVPAALESIKKIGLEKMEYIDLRIENRAYYKLK